MARSQSRDVHSQVETLQTTSWIDQVRILKETLTAIKNLEDNSGILLEYSIPRRAKRIDTVLLTHNIVFVLEFKIKDPTAKAASYQPNDLYQCEDYALDLRDFHRESRGKVIIPILVDTSVDKVLPFKERTDDVKDIVAVNSMESLAGALTHYIELYGSKHNMDFRAWESSAYEPTPTIIEAAQSLYATHQVRDITTAGADKYNLSRTTQAVLQAIDFARQNKRKAIIFVTGVPGSGKTLVGLNIAHDNKIRSAGYNASFLSGNYPLVIVLQQALAIDKAKREKITKKEALRDASTKVQHILNFKRHYFEKDKQIPNEHIIIFDEAQRAWNKEQMLKKSDKFKPYTTSEPELIMDIMNRHKEWAAIIGLVGTGQEIHNGEAGLREWGNTIKTKHKDWLVFSALNALSSEELPANQTLFKLLPRHLAILKDPFLHLKTSIRSYKASKLSDWVNAVLDEDPEKAKEISLNMKDYPIIVTRDLKIAKNWLKHHCRGSRSSGLVCSSGAKRLRPLGIEVSIELDVAKWFLSEKNDIRSSSFLELPATEFEIQGLERDWICLAWDQDFTRKDDHWVHRDFHGSKWTIVRDEMKKEYLLNTYRVLMTRGREGLAIFVPEGDSEDKTRNPELYDSIYSYLLQVGIPELQ